MSSRNIIKKTRILIVPMNWGLGHATRLIPIIKELVKMNVDVIVGGSPLHQKLFRQEVPDLKTIDIPYLKIQLSRQKNQIYSMIRQLPAFLIQILKEHKALKKLIRNMDIDIVISDNCYGLWNRNAYTIFLTHQLSIRLPQNLKYLQKILNQINLFFIRKFDECWIPDVDAKLGFAGELSHHKVKSINLKYIGVLSRFTSMRKITKPPKSNKKRKILFIISGPEKQRTIFENIIKTEIPNLPPRFDYTVIRGLPFTNQQSENSWLSHANSHKMFTLIQEADIIICRSGYSTIMDLIVCGKTAILVPTPGQTEQEYLASYLNKKGYFFSCMQHNFELRSVLPEFDKFRANLKTFDCNAESFKNYLVELVNTNYPVKIQKYQRIS